MYRYDMIFSPKWDIISYLLSQNYTWYNIISYIPFWDIISDMIWKRNEKIYIITMSGEQFIRRCFQPVIVPHGQKFDRIHSPYILVSAIKIWYDFFSKMGYISYLLSQNFTGYKIISYIPFWDIISDMIWKRYEKIYIITMSGDTYLEMRHSVHPECKCSST